MAALEPVEIDFLIGGNTETKGKEVEKTFDGIASASKQTTEAIKSSIAEQRQIIKGIEADLKSAEKLYKNMSPGKAQAEQGSEVQAVKKALAEQIAILNELEQQTKQVIVPTTSLRTQMMNLRNDMGALALAGKENTDTYRAMEKELGRLNDVYKDVQQQAKIGANDEAQFQGIIEGIGGVAGAFSAAQGAIGLFADENEQLEKIMLRVQSAMAITVGLQQVAQTLNKDSAFMLVTVRKAQQAWATSVAYLNTQMGINIGLSKVMVATGIGAIIAAVGLLIYMYNKQSEVEEKQKEQLEKKIKQNQDLASVYTDANKKVAEQIVSVNALRSSLKNENTSYADKKKAITELKELIPGYNATLDSQGQLIRENTKAIEAYITSINKQALAEAAKAKSTEIQAKILDAQFKAEEQRANSEKQKGTKITLNGKTSYIAPQEQNQNPNLAVVSDEFRTAVSSGYKQQQKELQEQLDILNKIITDNSDKLLFNADKKTTAAKQEYDANKALQEQILAINSKTEALKVQIIEDGLQQKLAALEVARAAEVASVEKKNTDIVAAYNKANPNAKVTSVFDINPQLGREQREANLAQQKAYEDKRVALTQEAADKLLEIQQGLTASFASEEEQQLQAVKAKYDKMRDEAAKLTTDGKLDTKTSGLIDKAQADESTQVVADFALKRIGIEQDTADMLAEIRIKGYNADARIEAQRLNNAVIANNKRIQALSIIGSMQSKLSIDELKSTNDLIKKEIKLNELRSINTIVKDVNGLNSALSDVFKNIDSNISDVLLKTGEISSNLSDAFLAFSTGNYIGGITSIVSGISKMINSSKDIAAENEKNLQKVLEDYKSISVAMELYRIQAIATNKSISDSIFNTDYLNSITSGYGSYLEATSVFLSKRDDLLAQAFRVVYTPTGQANSIAFSYYQLKTIAEVYPDIIDNENKLNIARAEAIKNTDFVSDATKSLIQEMIDLQTASDQALTQMNDALSSLVGDLGSRLSDSITIAFRNGTDAGLDFTRTIGNSIEGMIQSIAFSQTFGANLSILQNSLSESLTSGDQLIIDDFQRFFDSSKEGMSVFNEILQNAKDAAAASGFDIFGQTDASATKGGIAGAFKTMSQDTADVLTGQFTAIRQHTTNIPAILDESRNQNAVMAQQLAVQMDIRNNTGVTASELKSLNEKIERMTTNGLKVI